MLTPLLALALIALPAATTGDASTFSEASTPQEKRPGMEPIGAPSEARSSPRRSAPPSSMPRYALALGAGLGAFYSRSSGWVRSDAQLHLAFGLRLHRVVQLQLALLSSAERLEPGLRVEARWFPWGRGLYVKAALDLLLAGVGPQPVVAAGAGYAWWFRAPLGLYAELEAAGRVRAPLGFTVLAVGGICVHFGR